LSIVGLRYTPKERVSEFDLKILGGQVVRLSRVPIGWTISISNDPGWSSEISGKAIVGAAFMRPGEFINGFLSIKVLPGELKQFPGEPQTATVTGYVDLYKPDTMRTVHLSNANFVISPR
jgi:hypothetical protein